MKFLVCIIAYLPTIYHSSKVRWYAVTDHIAPTFPVAFRYQLKPVLPMSIFAAMVNSGQISDDTNKEFQEYTGAVNKFLDEIN